MAYPYDELSATQRQYPVVGSLADLLTASTAPDRTPQARMMAEFFGLPSMATTLDRISYGEPLTTGTNQTMQMKPETAESLLSVIGAVAPSGKAAAPIGAGLERVGMAAERAIEPAVMRTLNKGGVNAQMLQDMVRGSRSPMDVYHGSPYEFSAFDPSKIGSGARAQAYGYGHYVAQNPNTATAFRVPSAETKNLMRAPEESVAFDVASYLGEDVGSHAADRAKSVQRIGSEFKYIFNDGSIGIEDPYGAFTPYAAPQSYMYKIDLPDDQIAKMLYWDKEIGQQTPEVKALAKQYGVSMDDLGGDLIAAMNAKLPEGAEAMRSAGIPGIRYPDAKMRSGAKTSDENFVVFPGNEGLLQILERNGKKIR